MNGTRHANLLTVAETAALLGVVDKTVYKQFAGGHLPGLKLGGTIRIYREPVERLLAGDADAIANWKRGQRKNK